MPYIFLPWTKLPITPDWVRLPCCISNKVNLQINQRSRSSIDLDIRNTRVSSSGRNSRCWRGGGRKILLDGKFHKKLASKAIFYKNDLSNFRVQREEEHLSGLEVIWKQTGFKTLLCIEDCRRNFRVQRRGEWGSIRIGSFR